MTHTINYCISLDTHVDIPWASHYPVTNHVYTHTWYIFVITATQCDTHSCASKSSYMTNDHSQILT